MTDAEGDATTDVPATACYDCGRTHAPTRKRCDCGQPVWFDEATIHDRSTARESCQGVGRPGIWARARWLPVDAPTNPRADLGAATGGTPLLRTPGLDDVAGCRVWIQDETGNPTGTFKDRGTAVAIHGVLARASADLGSDRDPRIGTVSHGNMAMSTAAFAAAAGIEAVVLVPADVSAERLAAIGQYDPRIVRVEGDYGRLYHEALALADETGIDFVNSDTPLRVAGQKTVVHDVLAAFDGVPDGICLPTSSGGHASAVWKGLRELAATGAIDAIPPIYLAQAAACDPIARAYRRGGSVEAVDPDETVAYSIANPDPPSGDRALAAVRETGGAVASVDEEEIAEATDAIARRTGLCVEPSSAVALAGLERLIDDSDAPPEPDDEVVVVATGTGFKELDGGTVDAPVVELDRLAERL